MKKVAKYLILIFVICLIFMLPVLGDEPPDPGGDPTGDPVGGGSPIGGGLLIMIMASLVYGFQKIRLVMKK